MVRWGRFDIVAKPVSLDIAPIFLFHKHSILPTLNLQPGGASWRSASKCAHLSQQDNILLGAVLINQPADVISEKGKTIGNATTTKTGRW
jgi:hypothetical protein